MNTRIRATVRELEKRGFVLRRGSKHWKLFDPAGNYVMSLPFGNNRDRVPGGSDKLLRKLLR